MLRPRCCFAGAGILLLLGLSTFLYLQREAESWSGGALLYDGDRLEVRTCRMCNGSGRDAEQEQDYPELGSRCAFCRGSGKVQVVLPGQRRPTRIWGGVVDAERIADGTEIRAPVKLRLVPVPNMPDYLRNLPGAIAGARLTFTPATGGEAFEILTGDTGRFSRLLAPGRYTVKVQAPGFESQEKEFEVRPLEEPIWLERANLLREARTIEEAQSLYGYDFLAHLSRPGDREGFITFFPGSS